MGSCFYLLGNAMVSTIYDIKIHSAKGWIFMFGDFLGTIELEK
jgi:hypothetical protein